MSKDYSLKASISKVASTVRILGAINPHYVPRGLQKSGKAILRELEKLQAFQEHFKTITVGNESQPLHIYISMWTDEASRLADQYVSYADNIDYIGDTASRMASSLKKVNQSLAGFPINIAAE